MARSVQMSLFRITSASVSLILIENCCRVLMRNNLLFHYMFIKLYHQIRGTK